MKLPETIKPSDSLPFPPHVPPAEDDHEAYSPERLHVGKAAGAGQHSFQPVGP